MKPCSKRCYSVHLTLQEASIGSEFKLALDSLNMRGKWGYNDAVIALSCLYVEFILQQEAG